MFWRKNRPNEEILDFLEDQRIFYNEQVHDLKRLRRKFMSHANERRIRITEGLMESIIDVIRSFRAEPVFDAETGEIIKLEW